MMIRAVFALLLIAFPTGIALKVARQRRALGRSPVILGGTGARGWEASFERFAPVLLLFWPAAWLWIALGGAPVVEMPAVRALGLMLTIGGAAFSLASVFLMGRAWRIGIDPENRDELAESGPYRWVRHPIYSGWLVMLLGHVMLVPHPLIELGAIITALGVLYQAAREERHLLRTFGDRYGRYLARTGRFAPRL